MSKRGEIILEIFALIVPITLAGIPLLIALTIVVEALHVLLHPIARFIF